MHSLVKLAAGLGAVGTAGLAYGAGYEVRAFRLREATIGCLPPGHRDLRVLHLSDIHLTPAQSRKRRWLSQLAALKPDLVINTGDNLSHRDSAPLVMHALAGLHSVPGVFVFGSNDYWGPVLKNPARYLLPRGVGKRLHGPPLPWRALRDAFGEAGWVDLTNRRDTVSVHGTSIAFAGVDDPHLHYDRLEEVAGPADASADLRIGVAHAPYLRVLDAYTSDGYDVIFAGHTHGGQLRIPGYGAVVTNCDLEPARSRGLHRHEAGGRSAWMHVSAGLGTSPYAPYRFCCHPEATLVTLTAATRQGVRTDSGDAERLG
ncbi:MAG: metallophosphoesterase [Actinomycetota bacterium]|nr:metallophosphoesterase [Actinomycetota bacterium]